MLKEQTRIEKMFSVEWIGQFVASLSWIVSVFAYGGPASFGDWLQLVAASSWMASNVASVMSIKK